MKIYILIIVIVLSFSRLGAAIFNVGPERTYKTLQDVATLLNPGDIVEVDGDNTYPGSVTFERPGTAENMIHIKGIRVNGKRPVISGGTNSVHFTTPWPYTGPEGGHHYILEGFEITGAEFRGIFHQADNLVIRDCFVHDCLGHGILGADQGSGSILIEYTEVARCGAGDSEHQIYMATDEVNNPGSIFRLQHCYIHDGNGGNNVKSRAERNEIYYNWIEGAFYHELELIGADDDACDGNAHLVREDGDVVGNVLFKKQTSAGNLPGFFVVRIGGDGTGESFGRFRFLNNTIISGEEAVFRMYDALESIEVQNNVFYNPTGNVLFMRNVDANWSSGQEIISGKNNWVQTGVELLPAQLSGTVTGSTPGFIDFANGNLNPLSNSPLVNAGTLPTQSVSGHEFPNPLPVPLKLAPMGAIETYGNALDRQIDGTIDIGAFEFKGPSGISEKSNKNITVYPNPFSSIAKIEFELLKAQSVNIDLYDLLGNVVKNIHSAFLESGNQMIKINNLGLNDGIYILKVKGSDFLKIEKVVLKK